MEEQVRAVQRMQAYIQHHLYESITLADLAKASLYSPWHSHRLFAQWIGMTPADYIRRLRLSKSALKLRDESAKILDVALEFGFNSVDGYQRAFNREFGCNPRQYAMNPIPIYLFTPNDLTHDLIREEKTMENVKTVYIQVVEKPARKVLIKRGIAATEYWAYCEEVGCDLWGLLLSIKSISGEPVCMWLPPQLIKPGTSKYVQGVEVALDYDGVIPEGFDVIELPQCKYMMFKGEPFPEEDYQQAIGQIWKAIDQYDPAVVGYAWDDSNPRIQLGPIGTRGYIEMVAVK